MVTETFTAEVDLLETCCAATDCGMVLALSAEHIGAVVGEDCRVLVWHKECAPSVLRAAESARAA